MSASTCWAARGDWESARRKISQGTWEARRGGHGGMSDQRLEGIHNLKGGHGRESEWSIVARKSWKQDGAKGPHFSHVLIKEGRNRLSRERSITEWKAEGFQPEPGMPEEGLSSEMETGLQG